MPFMPDPKTQPPGVGEFLPNEVNKDQETVPDTEGGDSDVVDKDWFVRAQKAYQQSVSYLDSNYRGKWQDNIANFKSEHPSGSKFNTPAAAKMSRMFRPKTRASVRKNEAAASIAFFSNADKLSVTSVNQNDPRLALSAALTKELVEHRLETSIPWFQVLMGGIQDAQVYGVVCSHNYWDMTEVNGKKVDAPVIDIIPPELLLFDPGASWLDPVGTSPFLIHLMPMYVQDVKDMINNGDWLPQTQDAFYNALKMEGDDTTEQNRTKRTAQQGLIHDYQEVWVQRHIHRKNGEDYEFYMLGQYAMLSKPVPLSETVLHGKRPYTIGNAVLEAHNVMPDSYVRILSPLQDEANVIANQRLDNVKMALNKRYFAARDKNVDLNSLVRNLPASITMMTDPSQDVKVVDFQDVTQSSYAEQDRLNADYDALGGEFNAGSIATNRNLAETAKGMSLLSGVSNVMVEYLLRTFSATWVEPVLRQLVLLEQYYENDPTILAIAGNRANAFIKYGLSEITDQMIQGELLVKVNVGMSATDPTQKVTNLSSGINLVVGLSKANVPFLNIPEISKEIFGALGFSDGSRFIKQEADPQVVMLMQTVQKLAMELKSRMSVHEMDNATKLLVEEMKQDGSNLRSILDHARSVTETSMGQLAATKTLLKQPPNPMKSKVDATILSGAAGGASNAGPAQGQEPKPM